LIKCGGALRAGRGWRASRLTKNQICASRKCVSPLGWILRAARPPADGATLHDKIEVCRGVRAFRRCLLRTPSDDAALAANLKAL